MKSKYTLLLISSALTCTLAADTIKLKSGTTYQGEVLSEDAESYLVKIQYSASITDERRLKKSDISEIIPKAKDADDFKKIKSCIPTPDGLTEKTYAEQIDLASKFLKKYPKSTHRKKIQTILATLKKEHKVIASGGIKINGKLINATEAKTGAYDIEAHLLASQIKKRARARRFSSALRHWESLQKNYPNSEAYKASLTWIPRVLTAYESTLKKELATLDARLAKREKVLNSLDDKDRRATEAIIKQKEQRHIALVKKETAELKTKWLSINTFSKNSLDSNLRTTQSTLTSVKQTTPETIQLAAPLFKGIQVALDQGDLEQAHKIIQQLSTLQLPEKYVTPFSEQLAAQLTAIEDKKKAEEDAAAKAEEEKEKGSEKDKEKSESDKKNSTVSQTPGTRTQ